MNILVAVSGWRDSARTTDSAFGLIDTMKSSGYCPAQSRSGRTFVVWTDYRCDLLRVSRPSDR